MEVILNIGLNGIRSEIVNEGGFELIVPRCGVVLRAIEADSAIEALAFTVLPSDTEPTAVVSARARGYELDEAIFRLAVELNQDCIAIYSPDSGVGRLIGPGVAKRGAFDRRLFVLPNGRRLSEQDHKDDQLPQDLAA